MSGGANEYTCRMPSPELPMVDLSTGTPSTAWWIWAMTMFRRTGLQIGGSILDAQGSAAGAGATAAAAVVTANAAQATSVTALTSVASETSARIAGDNSNAATISAEATTRATGDATNAAAVTAEATARASAVSAEAGTRAAEDLLLLPLTGVRAMTGPLVGPVYTVGTLPAGVTGARAMVSNALAPSFGSTVAGGGAVTVPVFWNGAAWTVG